MFLVDVDGFCFVFRRARAECLKCALGFVFVAVLAECLKCALGFVFVAVLAVLECVRGLFWGCDGL